MKIHSSINLIKMKKKLPLIVIAAALLFFPNINFGQAPNLGTAANFVLFTSVGAVGNTGISQVTGNVGTNSGAITGFGNVNGVMHTVDGASALCTTDLLSAYNQLNATVPTLFPGTLLGNGVILTPGVYSTPSATTLNLSLILDAQGNSNAVFIFQIHGTFSANTNSKIKLINGAKACNVFWQIEGLTSMATGTTMRGTIIVNNAAINMNTGDTLEGRALSTAGAVNVNGVLAYTPIGCGSPLLTGPIAPTLASAACYALFSSDGPVTNVGITHVIGDVGTNLGSATGYNPLFVTGMIHPVPDGSTAACATDLLNAYNYLNTLPFDIELLYPAQFGHSLVLTPHTYRMNSAVTFTDSLYLNAENDANAVFVIQVKGAFSTSVNSKIILINGAQSKNVYWNIDGAVSINTNSIFRGNIICNNGAMNLNTNVTLDGRALTTTGALNTSAVNVVMPPGCGSSPTTTITTQPTNQATCAGGSVSFSVIASGTGLTYQWRKGTTNLINGGNISGATTATLIINPVTLADTSSFYNVIVGGTPNNTSINISLLLNTPSTIILQPVSQAVCIGSSVSFSVTANGVGLTYQWHKGFVSLINGGNISGATTGTLTINPTIISDTSSLYYVVIAGGCSNDTSVKVSLHFNNPTIVNQPTNQIACPGSSVSFSVSATGTGLTYQWRKGIINLMNGANISGVTTAILTINPVTAADTSSIYNVVISGSCLPNDTSIKVSLHINSLPIAIPSSNSPVCSGSSLNLAAQTVTGATYFWSGPNLYTSSVQNPTIISTTSVNAGIYSLTVSNNGCSADSIITVVISNCSSSGTTDLSVVKTVNNTRPIFGNTVVFVITANNSGPNVATGVTVIDILQSGYTYVASTVTTGTYNLSTGTWVIGTLTSGSSAVLTVTVTVVTMGNYVNTAIIYGNEVDPNMANNNSSVEAFPSDFFIPEGFSPNGDGINDVFFIRGIDNYPNNVFTVFNRWGDKVYAANSYQNTWDGKTTMGVRVGGDELPVGTYFYLLDLGNGSTVFKGTIYLNK